MNKLKSSRIDWLITLAPFIIIMALAGVLFAFPDASNDIISKVRDAREHNGNLLFNYWYRCIFDFHLSIIVQVWKYSVRWQNEKPKYSFFAWGSMMFTCGLAADILFYSFSEWVMYATNPHIEELGSNGMGRCVPTVPLELYSMGILPRVGSCIWVYAPRKKKKSTAIFPSMPPFIGKQTDGLAGHIIDLFALFALLAGTATTFSVATPFMAELVSELFHIALSRTVITIIILLITCVVYTYAVLHGFKGISFLAKLCIYLFFGLLLIVLVTGGQGKFIIENGFQSLGKMFQNFIGLSTYTDPERTNNFPQDWTIYYWAYWMVWSVAAPFFIGNISRGRTIKQTILGGYVFGVGSTIVSFIVLGNYGLGIQTSGATDFIAQYATDGDLYGLILNIIDTMPISKVILVITVLCMIAFYATSFDSIAYTAACYSYKELGENEHPHKLIELLWCVLLIVLPIALVFSESSMNNIQSISIISAFPIGIIMIIMIAGFFKDIKRRCEFFSVRFRSSMIIDAA